MREGVNGEWMSECGSELGVGSGLVNEHTSQGNSRKKGKDVA